MRPYAFSAFAILTAVALVAGCGEASRLPDTSGVGSAPLLPAPNTSLIPTVKVAPAKGWPAGTQPSAAAGMAVTALARGLDHPRWLYTLPNGDILVAESNKPANAGEGAKFSIRRWAQSFFMKRAGAGVPSADRITLLRDADGDGVAEVRSVLLQGLTSPFGMALVGSELFIANADAVVKFPYQPGQTQITAQGSKLWTVVNERDELGNDLVPDYLTSVEDGAFYGWPWSYFGGNVDERVKPPRPDMVAKAKKPDYALGSHVAPLGLAMSDGKMLGGKYGAGAFIGNHGSWNRKPPAGYKVVFVPFLNGQPVGVPQDVLTGFLSPEGDARGRPVGVAFDARGALLVADDVGNAIWRVAPAARQ